MDICTATISGNLVRDPEAKGQVARLRVAFKTRQKVQATGNYEDKSNFIDAVCFGKTAEIATSALSKGSAVVIAGRLEQSEWQAKDGTKRSEIRVLVNDLKLPPKGQNTGASAPAAVEEPLPF